MKNALLTFLFLGGLLGEPSLPEQAKEKFDAGNFAEAISLWTESMAEYSGQRGALQYNIGQSNLRIDSVPKALNFFHKATNVDKADPELTSMAWNNIGGIYAEKMPKPQAQPGMPGGGQPGGASPQPNIAFPQGGGTTKGPNLKEQLEMSLNAYKESLKKHHANEHARYNYELIKRKLDKLMQQQQENQDQDENKKDQNQQNQNQNQDKQDKDKEDQEKKDENKQDQEEKDQNKQQQNEDQNKEGQQNNPENKQQEGEAREQEMSMEQAKALLEAMNENEKQFLQQLQKSKRRRKHHQSGPDW